MLNDVVRDVVAGFDEKRKPSDEAVEKLRKDIESLSKDTLCMVESLSLGDQYALLCYCLVKPDRICKNVDFCIKAILDRREYKEYQYRWKPDWLRQCDKAWMFIYDSFEFVGDKGEFEERKENYEAIKNAKSNLETTEYTYESRKTVEFWYKRLLREVNQLMR